MLNLILKENLLNTPHLFNTSNLLQEVQFYENSLDVIFRSNLFKFL